MDIFLNKDGARAAIMNAGKSQRSKRRQKSQFFHPLVLTQHLTEGGKKIHEGVLASYHDICRESPTFFEFLAEKNSSKNRYIDIPLNDYNRVILSEPEGSDYYHASYIDGLCQPRQFVIAQAPFSEETEADFHRMVSQLKPEAILVMMKEDVPEAKFICPEGRGEKTCAGITFRIEEEAVAKHRNVKVSISGGKSGPHQLQVFFMSTWTNPRKIPEDIWEFKDAVKKKIPSWPTREAAVLLVSESGTKRPCVWYILDTEADRLQTKNRVRLNESVRQLRYQRNGALDSFELYSGLIDLMDKLVRPFAENKAVV